MQLKNQQKLTVVFKPIDGGKRRQQTVYLDLLHCKRQKPFLRKTKADQAGYTQCIYLCDSIYIYPAVTILDDILWCKIHVQCSCVIVARAGGAVGKLVLTIRPPKN
jgi:hypothetical protein